jgi:hypothetical protein
VLGQPRLEVEPRTIPIPAGAWGRFRCARREPDELLARDDGERGGHVQQAREAVRPVRGRVAFRRERPVALPDPGGVECLDIDPHDVVIEAQREGREAPLEEGGALRVVREGDGVQQMRAVPRVREHRRGPPSLLERGAHRVGRDLRRPMLGFRRRDPRRPHRVEVDGQPSAAEHVTVAGRLLGAPTHAVGGAGEERGHDRVKRDVDARRLAAPARGLVGQGIGVVEVPADGALAAGVEDPELRDRPRLEEHAKRATNFRGVRTVRSDDSASVPTPADLTLHRRHPRGFYAAEPVL